MDTKIVDSREAFGTIDGRFQFDHTIVIAQQDNAYYIAKCKHRVPQAHSEFYDMRRLVIEDRGPKLESIWTVVQGVPDSDYFIKTPTLFAYDGSFDIEQQIRHEVKICEILRKNPHPNIATYYGCQASNGRVSGIYFKRYASTLQETVNPEHLNKFAFLTSGRPLVDDVAKAWLSGIRAGIQHLHSLDIVHNDVTPHNIMFDDDNKPVLVDFDSCRHVGQSLQGTQTKRTYGWYAPEVETALKENDLNALAELHTWLTGSLAEDFLFKSG
jgi:serine/threonine protein kinase